LEQGDRVTDKNDSSEPDRHAELEEIAESTLGFLKTTADNAKADLEKGHKPTGELLAAATVDNCQQADRNLQDASSDVRRELQKLCDEPAICRVLVEEESGDRRLIYIARATLKTTPRELPSIASYYTRAD